MGMACKGLPPTSYASGPACMHADQHHQTRSMCCHRFSGAMRCFGSACCGVSRCYLVSTCAHCAEVWPSPPMHCAHALKVCTLRAKILGASHRVHPWIMVALALAATKFTAVLVLGMIEHTVCFLLFACWRFVFAVMTPGASCCPWGMCVVMPALPPSCARVSIRWTAATH